jgi:hypothetical protein
MELLRLTVADIGAAQQAYVAPGQPDGPWLERASSSFQTLSDAAALARQAARSTGTTTALRDLSDLIATLVAVDGRVRQYLQLSLDLLAADLIFSEGREALDALDSGLRRVRGAQQAAIDDERAALVRQTEATLGGVALLWVAGLALLVRAPAVKPSPGEAPPMSHLVTDNPSSPGNESRATSVPHVVDPGAAADLCVAISSMTTSAELPDLLARGATVLDAPGLIMWMSAGDELFPVASHGYDPRVINRLGPITRSADNAAAACWRSGETKAVGGGALSHGAIVAPLFDANGCIGVLSAEVRRGREHDGMTHAVTRMFAAQLAASVGARPGVATAPQASATGS